MTEHYPNPNIANAAEQPPVLTETETQLVLGLQAQIAEARKDENGQEAVYEYLTGVTNNDMFVSVDRQKDTGEFVIRARKISELVNGEPLYEQRMFDGQLDSKGEIAVMVTRGSGTFMDSAFGTIATHGMKKMLPTLGEKTIFPISEEGAPIVPEGFTIRPERVSVQGVARARRSGFRLRPR